MTFTVQPITDYKAEDGALVLWVKTKSHLVHSIRFQPLDKDSFRLAIDSLSEHLSPDEREYLMDWYIKVIS